MSIKVKFAIFLSLVLLLTTTTMGVIMIVNQERSLTSQMSSMAVTVTDDFASDSKLPLLQRDSLSMSLLVKNVLKYPAVHDAYILDDGFVVMAHKNLHNVGAEFNAKAKILGARGEPPWLISEGGDTITFASPIVFRDTRVGYASVSFSRDFISERMRASVVSVVLVGVSAILFVSGLSIPVATGLIRPVMRLYRGTREISIGNLDYRIPEEGSDEIGELVRSFNMMASELKKKEVLKGVFDRYVSPDVAEEILREPGKVRLGGERRVVTVFFADIRGFIRHAKGMGPEETVEVLNRYFTLVTEIIFRFNGTIDKFIGDAVMAVFGSPIKTDTHLESGVLASFAINQAILRVNVSRKKRGLPPFDIGTGLDSGEVIVGNMGSMVRMEYTAVGDAVNLASRLSGIARAGEILVSEAAYAAAKDMVEAEEVPGREMKGVVPQPKLYNITGLREPWKSEVEKAVDKTFSRLEEEGIVP